jgi:hypothetical protein
MQRYSTWHLINTFPAAFCHPDYARPNSTNFRYSCSLRKSKSLNPQARQGPSRPSANRSLGRAAHQLKRRWLRKSTSGLCSNASRQTTSALTTILDNRVPDHRRRCSIAQYPISFRLCSIHSKSTRYIQSKAAHFRPWFSRVMSHRKKKDPERHSCPPRPPGKKSSLFANDPC